MLTNWFQFTQKNTRWHHICWQFEKLFNYFVYMIIRFCKVSILIRTKSIPSSFIKFLIINLYYKKILWNFWFLFQNVVFVFILYKFQNWQSFSSWLPLLTTSFLTGILHPPLSLDKWAVEYFVLVNFLKKIIEFECFRNCFIPLRPPTLTQCTLCIMMHR